MSNRKLVEEYLDIVFSSHDFERLYDLFTPDLLVSGPILKCSNADEYVCALADEHAMRCSYQLISLLENANQVSVVYALKFEGAEVPMAQLFEVKNGHISKIILVCDAEQYKEFFSYLRSPS